jgi:hypothetical protein
MFQNSRRAPPRNMKKIFKLDQIQGTADITQQTYPYYISQKEVKKQFLRASPHQSFFPPKSINLLLHKHKPKRSGPKTYSTIVS